MASPTITELHVSVAAEEELAGHGLDPEDALEVSWNDGQREMFRDKVDGRYRMVGRNDGGALLTIIVEPTNEHGRWDVVTGWRASKGETTLWEKCQS